MSETKPEKRLVNKKKYAQVMGEKATWVAVSVLFVVLGVLVCFWTMQLLDKDWIGALVFGIMSLGLLVYARIAFVATKTIEPVVPITVQNAHLLPAQESLPRGSDLPPTIQQAELLRATQAGQETPKEQMLRATDGEKIV